MFIALRDKLQRKEEGGFTLIELMVVVLIIAILIAIAIPTFLGARKRAQDKQAQSNLRNALTAEKTYYVDTQAYVDNVGAGLTALQGIESSLDWTLDDGWTRGVDVESLEAGNNGVLLRSESKSGTWFCLMDLARDVTLAYEGKTTAGTYYAKSTDAVCAGEAFNADVGTGW